MKKIIVILFTTLLSTLLSATTSTFLGSILLTIQHKGVKSISAALDTLIYFGLIWLIIFSLGTNLLFTLISKIAHIKKNMGVLILIYLLVVIVSILFHTQISFLTSYVDVWPKGGPSNNAPY